jgi:beta-glucosidase
MALGWEDDHLPAIVQAWYPGQEGGQAVAEVLFGDVNPSGHLPVTFYRSTEDLPPFTDYSMAHRTYRYFDGKPLYAFGHGLSYTNFSFSGANLSKRRAKPSDTFRLTFSLSNAGKLDGDEIAQVYYRRPGAGASAPKMSLCGFRRVHVPKGASSKVAIDMPVQRFRHWDAMKKRYVVEPGRYQLWVGDSSDAIKIVESLSVAP